MKLFFHKKETENSGEKDPVQGAQDGLHKYKKTLTHGAGNFKNALRRISYHLLQGARN